MTALLLTLALGTFATASLRPDVLKCEYRINPLGLDSVKPRMTWTLAANRRGERQTAYQILVASNETALKSDRGDLWDTGKVVSDRSVQVSYEGQPLHSRQRIWWKVRVWDRDGNASAFSKPGWWEMGLLSPQDWKARWIGQKVESASAFRSHNGYHSAIENTPDVPKWVQIDLGSVQEFDTIQLHPAHPFDYRTDLPGMFFPVRFKVEVSETPGFGMAKTVVDQTDADVPNPGGTAPRYQFVPVTARYVRLIATRLRIRDEHEPNNKEYALALAQMRVLNGEKNLALNAPVTAQDSIEASHWSIRNLTDGDLTSHPAAEPPAPYLRKAFRVDNPTRQARLYVSAKGLYKVFLNGQRVGSDIFTPGWTDYRKRIQYQTYDVTNLLRVGENVLAITLGDGWYCGHVGLTGRANYGVAPRALAQLELEPAGSAPQTIVSDNSWKLSEGPIRNDDLLMGETYDAQKEKPGWNAPDYNDSQWMEAATEPLGEVPLVAQYGPTVQKLLELKPKAITRKPAGSYVFDLGQNMVGWARLKVKGKAGTTVRLRFAEMLNPDGTIYTTNLRGAKATDYYTLKGADDEMYEPSFTFHGFRYVELTGYPGEPTTDTVTGIVITSAGQESGAFTCSDPLVNQLQHNIVWGQMGNYLEVPTDCPQRDERLGWMGDAQIFARTACYNRDVAGFLTKWTQDVVDAQSPEGGFSDVSPRIGAMSDGSPAWGDAGVIVPWTLYRCYDDTRLLEERYEAMTKWIAYIDSANPDHLWKNRSNANYGDWLNIRADMPRDVLGTSYFAYDASLMAKIARALGKTEDAAKYDDLFQKIKSAYNAAYVGEDGRIKGDTQTCYVLALRFNLLPEEKRPLAIRYLVDDIVNKRQTHLSTGFVGVGYLLPTLTSVGHLDVAYKLLLNDTFPSWGYSIRHGATTIWERWDGWTEDKGFQDPGMNSFNHYSLGSVGEWLYATVAGIDLEPEQVGYKCLRMHPQPGGGLTHAKAHLDTLYGRAASEWKREKDGKFVWNVTVPANTTATVWVPASDTAKVHEGNKIASQAEGVKYVKTEDGCAVYEIGSGSYTFTALP